MYGTTGVESLLALGTLGCGSRLYSRRCFQCFILQLYSGPVFVILYWVTIGIHAWRSHTVTMKANTKWPGFIAVLNVTSQGNHGHHTQLQSKRQGTSTKASIQKVMAEAVHTARNEKAGV